MAMDLLYAGMTLLFFVAAVAYVAGCDRLAPFAKASGPKGGDPS
jgi:hypothetical protein